MTRTSYLSPSETAALRLLAALREPFRPYRGGPISAAHMARLVPHGLVAGVQVPVTPRRMGTAYRITDEGRRSLL